MGPSGCGKSTLLDLISGLSSPTQGRILIDGHPITGPGLDRGIVFQQYALFPWKTARGNIEFGLEAKGIPKHERSEQVGHFLSLVGLSDFGDRYPHELSGGMKQRVAIARSLAFNPDVLLMDEPLPHWTPKHVNPCKVSFYGFGRRPKNHHIYYAWH